MAEKNSHSSRLVGKLFGLITLLIVAVAPFTSSILSQTHSHRKTIKQANLSISRNKLKLMARHPNPLIHHVIKKKGKYGLANPVVKEATRFKVSPPLRTIHAQTPSTAGKTKIVRGRENEALPWADLPEGLNQRLDSIIQRFISPRATPGEQFSFQGTDNNDNDTVLGILLAPPDVNGDIGINEYTQYNNLVLKVFDKNPPNNTLMGPLPLSALFAAAGFTGACASVNDGDPIVLYDQYADRWLLTQFQVTEGTPFSECVALSTSGDPTGSYYLYEFQMPNDKFNDYPKFAVNPSAYYMMDHQFFGSQNCTGSWCGTGVFAFDRSAMLQGDPNASYIYFDLYLLDPTIGGGLFLDYDGLESPPSGLISGNLFIYPLATEFGDSLDGLRLFTFTPDFITPSNSTFIERPESPITVADYNPISPSGQNDVQQPGTSVGLDALSDRLMHRFLGRTLGTNARLTVAHTVCANSTPSECTQFGVYYAAFRWYILEYDSGSNMITLIDQGTFAPDNHSRWMPSAALDAEGNLCIGYTVSSSSQFPSVRYTCRSPSDPPGTLQAEQSLSAGVGTGSQTGASRWGDYSMLSVDPLDECSFWLTHQYYATPENCTASGWCWRTAIGKFVFPSCQTPQRGTLQGTVTADVPIPGAFVSIGSLYSRTTDTVGNYSAVLPPGTYTVTVTAPGCQPNSATVIITASGNTIQDFSMNCVPILALDSFTITGGNGDGYVDTNECNTLNVTLINRGFKQATGVNATITTSTPEVYFNTATSSYPTIAAGGGTATNSTPFQFSTFTGFGCIPVTAHLQVTHSQGYLVTDMALLPGGSLGAPVTYSYTGSLPIPDCDPSGASAPINVSGFNTTLGKVTATLHITHTWDGDLDINLLDPAGTMVELSTDNGGSSSNYGTGCPADADDTTFDDAAATPITSGTPPFIGAFIPEQPLTAFTGLSSSAVNGIWKLKVADDFCEDTGNIECWSLSLYPTTCDNGGGVCVPTASLVPRSLQVSDTTGNNNNIWEPGETVELEPAWWNIGGSTASNITGGLTSSDPGVTLWDASASYGNILSGSTGSCTGIPDCYGAIASTSRPTTHWDIPADETLSSGETFTWPIHVGDSFTDVLPSFSMYQYIETLLHSGITGGCTATTYCPTSTTTRAQMAIFIARALTGNDALIPSVGLVNNVPYNCSPAGNSLFNDIPPSSSYCRHVHFIAAQGITTGCTATEYCPTDTITRGQMAVFLSRAMVGSDSEIPTSGSYGACTYNCSSGGTSCFADIPADSSICRHVHYLASQGVTQGCTLSQYCPNDPIIRAQMATFLVRAFGLVL